MLSQRHLEDLSAQRGCASRNVNSRVKMSLKRKDVKMKIENARNLWYRQQSNTERTGEQGILKAGKNSFADCLSPQATDAGVFKLGIWMGQGRTLPAQRAFSTYRAQRAPAGGK